MARMDVNQYYLLGSVLSTCYHLLNITWGKFVYADTNLKTFPSHLWVTQILTSQFDFQHKGSNCSIIIVSWHQHWLFQQAVYFQQDSMISRLQKKKTNKQKTAVVHQSGTKVIMWSEQSEIIKHMYSCAWLLYKSSLNVPT